MILENCRIHYIRVTRPRIHSGRRNANEGGFNYTVLKFENSSRRCPAVFITLVRILRAVLLYKPKFSKLLSQSRFVLAKNRDIANCRKWLFGTLLQTAEGTFIGRTPFALAHRERFRNGRPGGQRRIFPIFEKSRLSTRLESDAFTKNHVASSSRFVWKVVNELSKSLGMRCVTIKKKLELMHTSIHLFQISRQLFMVICKLLNSNCVQKSLAQRVWIKSRNNECNI